MKSDMKEKHFDNIVKVRKNDEDESKKCFEQWNKDLDKCISVSGESFGEIFC